MVSLPGIGVVVMGNRCYVVMVPMLLMVLLMMLCRFSLSQCWLVGLFHRFSPTPSSRRSLPKSQRSKIPSPTLLNFGADFDLVCRCWCCCFVGFFLTHCSPQVSAADGFQSKSMRRKLLDSAESSVWCCWCWFSCWCFVALPDFRHYCVFTDPL